MGTEPNLTRQLATLGVHLPCWPEEPEGIQLVDEDWIERAQAYAKALQMWRIQLNKASESTKAVVGELLRHLAESSQLNGWDLWVATVIRSELHRQGKDSDWIFWTASLNNSLMPPAQLLAAILTIAADDATVFSSVTSQYLCTCKDVKATEASRALALIIEHACDSAMLHANHLEDAGQWLLATRLQGAMVSALSLASQLAEAAQSDTDLSGHKDLFSSFLEKTRLAIANHAPQKQRPLWDIAIQMETARQLIYSGNRKTGVGIMEEVVRQVCVEAPVEASQNAWKQLLINASVSLKDDPQKLVLIESKSLPRSGHHYLKRVLQAVNQEKFSYCEYYHEPGCCQVFPCNAEPYWHHARIQGKSHVRFVKSHDFALEDVAYVTPPGVIRLVQFRQPFDLLCSYLELEQISLNEALLKEHGISLDRLCLYHERELLSTAYSLIDAQGVVMHPDEAREWIDRQTDYILKFTSKWLPLCQSIHDLQDGTSGTYLLRYEDLGSVTDRLTCLVNQDQDEEMKRGSAAEFSPRSRSSLERESQAVSELLGCVQGRLLESEQTILQEWRTSQLLHDYSNSKIARDVALDLVQPRVDTDIFEGWHEVAMGKKFYLSSAPEGYDQTGLVNRANKFFFHTEFGEMQSITIDLNDSWVLEALVIFNRADACYDRAKYLFWRVHDDRQSVAGRMHPILAPDEFTTSPGGMVVVSLGSVKGRFITILSRAATSLHFSAVEAYASRGA